MTHVLRDKVSVLPNFVLELDTSGYTGDLALIEVSTASTAGSWLEQVLACSAGPSAVK